MSAFGEVAEVVVVDGDDVAGHSNAVSGTSEVVVQSRHIHGGVHVSTSPPVRRPRQLPLSVGTFTGRERELAELDARLRGGTSGVVISAVSGTAGVGKTALAVHWAHGVADEFPDGQLYVNLRGYDREPPLTPDDVLAGFLRALGVSDIPSDGGERAARYRTLLADRRVLVVLDNAGRVDQVLPLLPGGPSCFVVVTSRDRMSTLRVRYGAHGVDLDLLPLDDALRLLRATVGPRVDDEPGAARALVRSCASLPLALGITAEIAAVRERTPLADIAEELADERRLLGVADDDHSIRTVFSWSLKTLDERCRLVFRFLGLHPGREYDVPALAALADLPAPEVRRAVDDLLRVHLVAEVADGRLRTHDLLAAYARDLAAEHFAAAEAERSSARLFEHYRRLTAHAVKAVTGGRQSHRRAVAAPTGGLKPDRAWFATERLNLEAVLDHARGRGVDAEEVGHLAHDLGVLTRAAGDLPVALRHFAAAAPVFPESRRRYSYRIRLDEEEAKVAAGLHAGALRSLPLLGDHLRVAGMTGELAEADRLTAVAALACGDPSRAIRLARAAQRVFEKREDPKAAALCSLTYLAAVCTSALDAPNASPNRMIDKALSTAARLDGLGMRDEADHARLLGVRLAVAAGQLDRADALLGQVAPPTLGTPTDQRLLHVLCEAELIEEFGEPEVAIALAAEGYAEVGRSEGRPAGIGVAPASTVYGRALRALALRIALRDHDPGGVFEIAEQFRPQRQGLTGGDRGVRLDAVADQLGARALVGFAATSERLIATVVVDGRVSVVDLDLAGAIEHARLLRADLDSASAVVDLSDRVVGLTSAQAGGSAAELDRHVVRPLLRLIGGRDLVVVPAEPLAGVPWSALPSLHGRPLVVAPSVGAWSAARRRDGTRTSDRGVFVVGPGMAADRADLAELADLHPRAEVVAPEVRAVLGRADGARFLHLVARREHEPENFVFSRVVLADGALLAHEFGELEEPPDLVVLPGSGERVPGEVALGFANGLLVAGVRTVVVAVARVAAQTTVAVMRELHTALAAGEPPGRALAGIVAVDPLRRPFLCVGSGE
ncbi:putative ATPase [Saccharothrix saharensis]|uniref:Putative ATPase n=1 Tax=Saccharothrix saharensis TaxID=571190 RepID=A0A543JQ54_9PSEU|nr:CHAT domain-containing protein [Saccharothrix saharensis]TQM84938.1 putative ATPase [Saccharothrix saharensis]